MIGQKKIEFVAKEQLTISFTFSVIVTSCLILFILS